jgi:MoaA/NifB/PqqE/SkfB family radical SAM enzyme
MHVQHVLTAWGRVLSGRAPMLSIEITRECPLHCPGCYAYGDSHLSGSQQLKDLTDFKGDDLVRRVLALVDRHKPMHVSLVGGEPLMRRRELDRILPLLARRGVFTLVVTSGVIPLPSDWDALPRLTIAVSVDGLPEHHDVRRAPATYERILRNTAAVTHNVHLTITRPMVQDDGYLDWYMRYWSERPNVRNIWTSVYTPQRGENSPEMLTADERARLAETLPRLAARYPKMTMNPRLARAYAEPPRSPAECTFAQMSVNYTADLRTRVEPCIFGGDPDCSQCGCAVSAGFHCVAEAPLAGPLKVRQIMKSSIAVGSLLGRLRPAFHELRWHSAARPQPVASGRVADASSDQVAPDVSSGQAARSAAASLVQIDTPRSRRAS